VISNLSQNVEGEKNVALLVEKMAFNDPLVSMGNAEINIKHVFAGIAASYQENDHLLTDIITKPVISLPSVDLVIPTNMDFATYVGDIGVVANNVAHGDGNLVDEYYTGINKNYDLEGDIDSYAIRKMLNQNPNLLLSDVLATYYTTNNAYYQYRFTNFQNEILPSQDSLAAQAFTFGRWMMVNNMKNNPSEVLDFSYIERVKTQSWNVAETFIDQINERAHQEITDLIYYA
jgi:hypothetical protein